MSEPRIEARGLGKTYRRYAQPRDRLVEWLSLGRVRRHVEFVALEPLDLVVRAGECLGIVGENGAGKSTLLKLVSGVLEPGAGQVTTRGRVVSLLELGTGFHPELDGVANIRQSARVLGFDPATVEQRLAEILAFAELGEFLHEPVKSYSSGMYVRLAFALFAHLDPEIYVVDEALSVGDVFFQQKCFRFLEGLKRSGAAVLFASHDMQAVLRLADRVLLLEHGRQIALGDPVETVHLYYSRHGAGAPMPPLGADPATLQARLGTIEVPAGARFGSEATGSRRGSGEVRLLGARFVGEDGTAARVVTSEQTVRLQIFARAEQDIDDLTFGFQVTDRLNAVIFGQTIFQKDRSKLTVRRGETLQVEFEIDLALAPGVYAVQVAATDCTVDLANRVFDLVERALSLEVRPAPTVTHHGLVALHTRYSVVRSQT